jgi:hypothetical protein
MKIILSVGIALLLLLAFLWWRSRQNTNPAPEAFFASEGGETLLKPETDWIFLDTFLSTWDRFAQGENELIKSLNKDIRRFNAELARALYRDPAQSMGRAIMYPLFQVGGFVPLDSAVGKELSKIFGQKAPQITDLKCKQYYFAGDLYFWWEEHKKEFNAYQLYEAWRDRPFAKTTAIPMYQQMQAARTNTK